MSKYVHLVAPTLIIADLFLLVSNRVPNAVKVPIAIAIGTSSIIQALDHHDPNQVFVDSFEPNDLR